MPRTLGLLVGLLSTVGTFAQEAPGWLEETMYHSGKINTVIAVVTVILGGISVWLFTMDRRIKRMEEQIKK